MQACTQHRHKLIPIHTRKDARTHASACKQTDRRTDACTHAECMATFIPKDRQVHGGLPAHTHAQMHTYMYVRTHVFNTYIHTFCLFDLILYVPVNSFSVMSDGRIFLGWTSTKQGLMSLAQGHNAMTPVRLEPAALESSTLPLSHCGPHTHTHTHTRTHSYIHTWATPPGRVYAPLLPKK